MKRNLKEGRVTYTPENNADFQFLRHTTIDQFVSAKVYLTHLNAFEFVTSEDNIAQADQFITNSGLTVNSK